MNILISGILKTVHYRVYKCTAILHIPMGRTHREASMSKLDNNAKRVANIYGISPSIKSFSMSRCMCLLEWQILNLCELWCEGGYF